MPTPTTYSYVISTDITAAACNGARLESEIAASSIVTAVDTIVIDGDDLDVTFKDVLSGADETTLDGIVEDHPGTPLPDGERDSLGNPIYRPYGFAYADESIRWKGVAHTATLNAVSQYHYAIPSQWVGIKGGRWCIKNGTQGDLVEFRLTDQDNVLGYGAGLVIDKFYETHYVWPDTDSGSVEASTYEPLVPGLYLTIHYTSTATTGSAPWISLDLFAVKT